MEVSLSWNLTFLFVLSQVLTLFCYGALCTTYVVRKRRTLLFCSLMYVILFTLSMLCLKAWAGFYASLVSLARTTSLIIYESVKKEKQTKITVFDTTVTSLAVVGSIIVAWLTWDSFLSLFGVLGIIIYAISVYLKNIKLYRVLAFPIGILMIIYATFIGSYFGMIFESILLGVAVASYFIYIAEEKRQRKQNQQIE